MRYLVVEDDADNLETIKSLIQAADVEACVHSAEDRESAYDLVRAPVVYDLMILDLRIPASVATPEFADISQGLALLDYVRSTTPGSIIRVLTGFGQMDMASDYQGRYSVTDTLGYPALRFVSKENMLSLRDIIVALKEKLSALDSLELNCVAVELSVVERRLFAFHAIRIAAVKANISMLGGFSGARTFKAEFYDETGSSKGRVVAKFDSVDLINKELDNYHNLVAPFIAVGAIAALAGEKIAYYDRAAIFFRLANDYPYDFYQYCLLDANKGASLVQALQRATGAWVENTVTKEVSVSDVVSSFVDNVTELLKGFKEDDARRISSKLDVRFRSRVARQHGDLHGQNILVSANGDAVLIDFQHVGKYQPPIDPVTLELSLAFHPGATNLRKGWPSKSEASKWFNVHEFCGDSNLLPVVEACRSWAETLVAPV